MVIIYTAGFLSSCSIRLVLCHLSFGLTIFEKIDEISEFFSKADICLAPAAELCRFNVTYLFYLTHKTGNFQLRFWGLLSPKTVISKLSGNIVETKTTYLPKYFSIFDFATSNYWIDTKFKFWLQFPLIWHHDCQNRWYLRYGAPKRGLLQPR